MSRFIGNVSAYAYAVSRGYTGTEEEYAALMASYATVAEEAAESAESASQSATQASTKASEASTSATQAGASATSASQSAQTATTKASEASASASTASTKASEASASATTASSKASEASASATSAQTAQGLAESARDDAIDAKTDAETARDLAQQYAESIDPENIYSVYATDTASGAVATFTDGADNIPMKSVVVNIEHVQDLHGQDAPYPAGTTANLFKATSYGGDYNKAVGGDLKNYQTMPYEITSDGRVVIDIQTAWRGRVFATDALNAGDYVCKVYLSSEDGRLTTYITDSDLVVKSVVFNYSAAGWSTVKNISVSEGDRIAVFIGSNAVGKLISEFQVESGTTLHDIVPFENICPISGWTGAKVSHSGADRTNPTTYSITFPTEAGTVYGGELDVTNGTLTVDRAMVDLGTLSWYASPNPAGMVGSNMDVLTFPSALYSNPNVVSDVMCEKFKTSTYNSVTTGTDGIAVFGSGDVRYIRIFYDGYIGKTAKEVKADLDGVKLIYTLLTPTTYHLTPTEIKSLLGDNNIWADAGDTTVTYRADTAKYIDKKIAEVINALS